MSKRTRRAFLTLGLVIILAVVVPFGLYRVQTQQAKNELADFVAELDRTAAPWRLADLERRQVTPPDEENSATVIMKAKVPNTVKFSPPDEWKLRPNQLPDQAELIKLREYLDLVDENIREARRLVAFPRGQFYVKIAPDVISTLIPHVQDVRSLGGALQHDASWQMHQANFDEAAQSIHAAINASRSLRDELFLISHLVRYAVLNLAARSLERMAAQGEPPVRLLPPLRKALLEDADFDAWTLAMAGERAGMHQLFEHLDAGKVDMRLVRGLAGARREAWHSAITDRFLNAKIHQAQLWTLRHYTDLLAAGSLPAKERGAKLQELNERLGQAPELAQLLVAPVWKNCYPVFERAKAKLRCAAVGLAAEEFRQKNGRWPRTVEELTPGLLAKMPLDPYTDEPLMLRPTPDGIVIYSLGPEGDLRGAAWENPEVPEFDRIQGHEFRLWNVDQRRRP